jgi:hypothetical protein
MNKVGFAVTLLLISVSLGPVQGEMVNDDLEIEYSPESVVLGPGEETTVTIVVTSHSDEPMDVAFEFIPVDAPRHAEGYFTTVFTNLGPGAEKKNDLVVKSNAERGDDEDVSNFVVVVYWGSEIQLDENQRPTPSSVDGTWEHEFSVLFNAEPELGYLPVAIVLGMVFVIAGILFYPVVSKRVLSRRGGEQ